MKRIVITSFKGGVGKSSVALHLGCCLAKYHNKKALLVDFDSQSNLSVGCGLSPDNRATMSEVLKGTKKMEDIIQETKTKNLFIAPANTYLDGIESSQSLVTDLYAHERLSYNLERLKYDYILIDVPPSLGWLTQSAFYASTHSLIVAIPELYSFLAVHRLKKYHATIETRRKISMIGVVMNFWDTRGASNNKFVQGIDKNFSSKVFDTKIRRDKSISNACLRGRPVHEIDEKARASQDFINLTHEFLERIENGNDRT